MSRRTGPRDTSSAKVEVYISIDVEADGPIPGANSMLALGAAAFRLDSRTPIATFEVNLLPVEGALRDPETMAWWEKHPEAWAATQVDPQYPDEATRRFAAWLRTLSGKPVLVAYPATYDFMWVYWYYVKFVGFPAPFGFQGLDLKTLAMARLGCSFKEAAKKNMPKWWFGGVPPHTHRALDDAIGQGVLFVNIMKEPPR